MSNFEKRSYYKRSYAPTLGPDNRLSGQAAPFNSATLIGTKERGFREQIAPGAFDKTIQESDIVLLDNHDTSRPLARMSAGTLALNADARGLQWSAQATDTSYAQDVVKNVRAGNYGGCSFSFAPIKESWDDSASDGIPLRTLHEASLREVSIVTFPAYGDTNVANREMIDLAFERRDAFFSRADAGAKAPKPYGAVKYADPKNGKYPLDTKKRVKAAWAFINEAQNAAKYPLNGVTLSDVKNNIIAAAKSFGIQIAADSGDGRSVLMAFEHDDPKRPLTDAETRELIERIDAARIRQYERHKRAMQLDGDLPGPSYSERERYRRIVHGAIPLDERSAHERARWNGDRGKRGW